MDRCAHGEFGLVVLKCGKTFSELGNFIISGDEGLRHWLLYRKRQILCVIAQPH